MLALSVSGVGGQVPGMEVPVVVEVVESWAGWEDKGPPPGVGGRDKRGLLFCLLLDGGRDGGGLSSGAGTEQSLGLVGIDAIGGGELLMMMSCL